ncbi:hypothetical protein COO60DRAFT_1494727 [Scenedesmus sp. NREL 46B-D3]|nr:hypothetical protein COO60DRAFT_1494727 [Scenedesmus sp. NREL 46B-D3]
MCRFSATQPSKQAEQDLADGFDWFDAIDEICTEDEEDQLLAQHEQLEPQPGASGSGAGACWLCINVQRQCGCRAVFMLWKAVHDQWGAESQQKHTNNAAGKHTVTAKHTKVSKATLAAMDEAAKLERVKQKRRESASRSRARKNTYMKELETENMALQGQVESLQKAIGQLQAYISTMGTPVQGAASMACC